MKAIEIIKALTDGWLNTDNGCGAVCLHEDQSVVDYFGTKDQWNGFIVQNAEYFYLYIEMGRENEAYRAMGELPDAYCERKEEQDTIALWRIE